MSTFLFVLLCSTHSTFGFFGKVRICEGEQYDGYNNVGKTLANEYRDQFITYYQLVNTISAVTRNATFEPLCTRQIVFSYQYYLRQQNIPNWGILLASLVRTTRIGKTICECKIYETIFYFTEELQKQGNTPSEESIQTVLDSFGYLQHPDWYANCPVLNGYIHRLAYEKRYEAGQYEHKIQQVRASFERVGKILVRPLLLHGMRAGFFLQLSRKRNEMYCFIYNSSAKVFARKNDTLGNEETCFLLETVANTTGNPRVDASCLNSFLEAYAKEADHLGTPISNYNMLEGLYRNDGRLSTVTDYDKCECRIPSLSKKLANELVNLGPAPDATRWNNTMTKYGYIGWSLAYRGCPILEWYLKGIAKKHGVETAEQRFLEVGFDIAKVLHMFSDRNNFR